MPHTSVRDLPAISEDLKEGELEKRLKVCYLLVIKIIPAFTWKTQSDYFNDQIVVGF